MKVIYYQDPRGNFGDELNRWLWPRIFANEISGFGHHGRETWDENNAEELLFYGIGTILDNRIPPQPEKIVFGSGVGYGEKPEDLEGFNIFFVRGASSARELGVSPSMALTDPAILLRHFFPLVPEAEKIHDISFMPHHSSAGDYFWRDACDALNINYISPRGFDVEAVVSAISGSRLVIAEAMHAAIVADTFRVPWIPVSSVQETNDFKWQDWCGTLGMEYNPVRLTPIFSNVNNSLWKVGINTLKQVIRERQLTNVVESSHLSMMSDSRLLDAHRMEMDLRVQELLGYLQQRNRVANVAASY